MFFLFKQKSAYEMRIIDWSSDVCSSDLLGLAGGLLCPVDAGRTLYPAHRPLSVRPAGPARIERLRDRGLVFHHLYRQPVFGLDRDRLVDDEPSRLLHAAGGLRAGWGGDRKSTRLNSSH